MHQLRLRLSFTKLHMDLPLDPAGWPGTPEWDELRDARIKRHRAWVESVVQDYEDERTLRRPHK